MLPRPVLAFVALALAAVSLCSCRTPTSAVEAKGEAPVFLSSEQKRATHTAKLANRIVVTLPRTDIAQYRWEISSHDPRYLRQSTPVLAPRSPLEGATVSFIAIRTTPNRPTRVRFVLLPLGSQREAVPVDTLELEVNVE